MRIRVGQRQDKYPVLQSFLKVQLLHPSEQMLLLEPGQLNHRLVHILPVHLLRNRSL